MGHQEVEWSIRQNLFDTVIECQVPRTRCKEHGVKMVSFPWAEKGSSFTFLFEALVIKWLEAAPVSAVSERMRIDWDSALRIQYRAVERGLNRREPVTPIDVEVHLSTTEVARVSWRLLIAH